MKKKRVIWLLLLLVAGLGILTAFVFTQSEPRFEGKPLSYWLKKNEAAPFDPEFRAKADAALTAIGPKAIPMLLGLLRAKDSRLKIKAATLAEKVPLLHYSFWRARSRNQAGRHGFQVLGAQALGAVPELKAILERHISDESEACTAWALGAIGPGARDAVPVLLRQLAGTNDHVRESVIWALSAIHAYPEQVMPALIRELDNPNGSAPSRVYGALNAYGRDAGPALSGLLARINSTNENVRSCIIFGLRKIHPAPDQVLPVLTQTLSDVNARIGADAADTLGEYGLEAKPAVPALLEKINDPNQLVRDSVVFALGKIHASPELAVPALHQSLADADRDVRRHAADSLGAFGNEAKPAVAALLKMLNDPSEDQYARRCAEMALKKIDPEALDKAVKEGRVKLP